MPALGCENDISICNVEGGVIAGREQWSPQRRSDTTTEPLLTVFALRVSLVERSVLSSVRVRSRLLVLNLLPVNVELLNHIIAPADHALLLAAPDQTHNLRWAAAASGGGIQRGEGRG